MPESPGICSLQSVQVGVYRVDNLQPAGITTRRNMMHKKRVSACYAVRVARLFSMHAHSADARSMPTTTLTPRADTRHHAHATPRDFDAHHHAHALRIDSLEVVPWNSADHGMTCHTMVKRHSSPAPRAGPCGRSAPARPLRRVGRRGVRQPRRRRRARRSSARRAAVRGAGGVGAAGVGQAARAGHTQGTWILHCKSII
jgi:hypothetical protein